MENEREIDLRPVFAAALQRWRLILFSLLIVLIAALVWIFFSPTSYQASAQVLIAGTRAETSFQSTQEDRGFEAAQVLGNPLPDQLSLTAGMLQIALSGDVLSRTVSLLGEDVPVELRDTQMLARHLSTSDDPRSGLITLRVSHPDGDLATTIANAWAASFVAHGNQVYSASGEDGALAGLQERYERSRQEYEQKEQALADFIRGDGSEVLGQRLGEYRTAIDSLRLARTTVLSNTAAADALSATELISSYTRLRWSAYTTVISETNRYELQQLSDAYATLRRLELLRPEVQALRDHLAAGGDAQSAALALQLLKVRAFSAGDLPADGLELQAPAAAIASAADVESMLATIDERLAATRARIAQLNEDLSARSPQLPPFDPAANETLLPAYTTILSDNLLQRALDGATAVDDVGQTLAPDTAIAALQREAQQMEAELQRVRAQRFVLEQERDTARSAYASLGLKIAELSSTSSIGEQVVRLASNAGAAAPVAKTSRYLQAALLLVATLLAVLLYIAARALSPQWLRTAAPPATSADVVRTRSG
jgi:capsular polysaccharide biosynthesis protein